MLIDKDTESKLERVIQGLVSSYAVYSIGRQIGQTIPQAAAAAVGTKNSPLTYLEVSYLAGKVARQLGPNRLKSMNERQLIEYLRTSDIVMSAADRKTLSQLKDSTERWLKNRTGAWSSKLRTAIDTANKEWRTALAQTAFTDNRQLTTARNAVLLALVQKLDEESDSWDGDVDRVLQTEMNTYYQQGQVSGAAGNELVYKVPRVTACKHCLRIHLDDVGNPRIYKLSEVIGNSNIGMPAPMWQFTIGPTHPYCYCVLYYATDKPPKQNPDLEKALKDSRKGPRPNTCGVPDDSTMLFEDQVQAPHEHQMQPHELTLIAAARKVFAE